MHNNKKHKLGNSLLRLSSLCYIFLLFPFIVHGNSKIPRPTTDFFVNDYARVLDSNVKNEINQKSRQYQADGGPQIVVATIKSLEGDSIEDYSIRMAREWGIGSKEENNGILILLSVEDRSIRVEVGYGLEGVITDSLSGRFIREATPELSNNDYSSGIKKIYDLILQELEEPGSYQDTSVGTIGTIATFILFAILIMFGGFFGPRRRRFGGYYGGGFGGGGGGGFRGGGGSFGGGGASGKFIWSPSKSQR